MLKRITIEPSRTGPSWCENFTIPSLLPSPATDRQSGSSCLLTSHPTPPCLRLAYDPAVLSATMDSFPEHNPKLTFEEIKELDSVELLGWFQREWPETLQGDKLDKFR